MITLLGVSLLSYTQSASIRINQLGYYPAANKIALVANTNATSFEIVNTEDGTVELSGEMTPGNYWSDAGDSIQLCDFSELTKPGTYKIQIPGFGASYTFEISSYSVEESCIWFPEILLLQTLLIQTY